jgi:hypothetical protein
VFISYKQDAVGRSPWETPFGVVTEEGMKVLRLLVHEVVVRRA